ncbi:hypothetical protein ES705_32136 [subsurface metagenome]
MRSSIVGQTPDRTQAVVIPLPCKSWDCDYCGPRKRAAWIAKLERGDPQREFTLTCPVARFPDAIQAAKAMKRAWSKLVPRIRKLFGAFEYALVWELTKRGVPHCHILTRGKYIPQKWISRQWDLLGIGPVVYIRSLKGNARSAAHACKYLAKSNGQTAKKLAPLRLVQLSRGYEIQQDSASVAPRFAGFVFTWDRRSQAEILREFTGSYFLIDIQIESSGEAIIRMREHHISPDLLAYPEFWAASPGYHLPEPY